MKRVVVFLLIVFCFLSFPIFSVDAARVRVRKSAAVKRSAGVSYATVRKSVPTHSLKLIFNNLGNVSKITYEVQYNASAGAQGIVGSLAPSGSSDGRDVYLGTCSSGVCTPHLNIKKIVVVIRVTLKGGGVYTKVARAATF